MNKIQLYRIKTIIHNFISVIDNHQIFQGIYRKLKNSIKNEQNIVTQVNCLYDANKLVINWPTNLDKPFVGLVRESEHENAYWPKYEKLLLQNDIPYEFFDPHKSNFWIKAQDYDFIVWRTPSTPHELWEAKAKITLLSRCLNKHILPEEEALWFYEEKINQQWLLELNQIPCINTFISYSHNEVLEYINNVKYPIISKENTSSASQGVFMLKEKSQAQRFVKAVFNLGSKTTIPYLKQKNYVIFQEYTPNYGFDLRVIVIGDQFLGYYRHIPQNDFRASGAGIYSKKAIPKEALLLAKRVKDSFPKTHMLAVDMLQDKRDDLFKVIETSIFIGVDTCEQLKVDGVPGVYKYINGEFYFEPGRYWIQELMLKEALEEWIMEN